MCYKMATTEPGTGSEEDVGKPAMVCALVIHHGCLQCCWTETSNDLNTLRCSNLTYQRIQMQISPVPYCTLRAHVQTTDCLCRLCGCGSSLFLSWGCRFSDSPLVENASSVLTLFHPSEGVPSRGLLHPRAEGSRAHPGPGALNRVV